MLRRILVWLGLVLLGSSLGGGCQQVTTTVTASPPSDFTPMVTIPAGPFLMGQPGCAP